MPLRNLVSPLYTFYLGGAESRVPAAAVSRRNRRFGFYCVAPRRAIMHGKKSSLPPNVFKKSPPNVLARARAQSKTVPGACARGDIGIIGVERAQTSQRTFGASQPRGRTLSLSFSFLRDFYRRNCQGERKESRQKR